MLNHSEKHHLVSLLLIGCLFGGIGISLSSKLNVFQHQSKESTPIPLPTQISRPILINGNGNFTGANGVSSGGGNASSPYLITNLVINAATATGIEIENTNAFVIIQNCSITDGGSNFNGIFLSNVQNVVINENTITSNEDGIYLNTSNNNTVANNTVNSNSGTGIYLYTSSNDTVVNNTVDSNSATGIYLYTSSNENILLNNTADLNYNGILLDTSCNNNTVANNIAQSDTCNGLEILTSSNYNIFENNTADLDWQGIYIYDSNYNVFTLNSFAECGNYETADLISTGNIWYFHSLGNYYSDYVTQNPSATNNGIVWNKPYTIGESSDSDAYPLCTTPLLSITRPPNQQFAVGTTGHILNWTLLDPATHVPPYQILQNGTPFASGIWISGTPITCSIDGLAAGTYNFTINATDGYSAIIQDEVDVLVSNPLAAPILQAISSPSTTGNVTLTWNAVTGATSYYVYQSNSSITDVNDLTPIATVPSDTYTVYGLTCSINYFVIVATNSTSESGPSNCENVTVNVPPNSPVLQSIPGPSTTGNVILMWNAVTSATSYNIYRATTPITTITGLTPLAMVLTGTNYNDYGLTNGTYYYVIVANNSFGDSIPSNCESVNVVIQSSSSSSNNSSSSTSTSNSSSTSTSNSNSGSNHSQSPFALQIAGFSLNIFLLTGAFMVILLFRLKSKLIKRILSG
jgi:parallel beta-helix repeat protein